MRIPRLAVAAKRVGGVFAAGMVCLALHAMPAQAALPSQPAAHDTTQVTAFADRYQSNRYNVNQYSNRYDFNRYGRGWNSTAQCSASFDQGRWGYRMGQGDLSCSTQRGFGNSYRNRQWQPQPWGAGRGYNRNMR